MWLLWYTSYNNSIDFIGLYKNREAGEEAKKINNQSRTMRSDGYYRLSFVEVEEGECRNSK